ncbi:MAG: adenylate/guanylate cyclase domain-containing protein [Alphaproteobacteria bacterium]|nr:adenylate/guanylate cyclase domain-containing protein [Alphaproteobacteria bacterium]
MPFLLRRGLIYVLPLVALVIALVARLAAPDLLDRLMLISFDAYQRIAPRPPGDAPIRVVDIDEDSLGKYGQWPWPRSLDAQLLDKLREAGAAVVAFDIVFAEPDRTSPKLLLAELNKQSEAGEDAARLLTELPDPDDKLAAAMKEMPSIAGFILTERGQPPKLLQKAGYAFAGEKPLAFVDKEPAAIVDLPQFQTAAVGNGFLNEHVDWDQIVRRVPLIMQLADKPVFSLVAETLRVATGARTYIARASGANGEKSFGEATGLTTMKIGPLTIPTDAAGRVWVYYSKPRLDRFISAAQILSGDFDPALVKDHIVLIGTSAAGVVNDLQATPVAAGVPGVEVHAQLLEQILGGIYLARPDWGKGAEILFAMVVSILLIVVLPRIGALASAILGAAAIVIAIGTSWYAFRGMRLLIDPVYPTTVLALVYLTSSILGYLRTEVRQHQIRSAFSRYMSPHYVEELARNPEKLQLGGEYKELTVMFCDIRGFTTMSEGLDARALTHLMNSFTSPMSEIIADQRGTIDKYIGDCIMAFWNAPLDDPQHAQNAVRAAQGIRAKLVSLNQQLRIESEAAGRPYTELRGGIGINTGECVVGNFGSEQRFNYSLMGDPVNLASRLEGLCKVYHVDLVIGEETAEMLADPNLIELDLVAVKGKSQAVKIFTLPPPDYGEEFLHKGRHGELLAAYRRQDWAAALGILGEAPIAAARYLAPVYQLYRDRIAHFQIEAPPENWDGVFTATEK